MADLLKIGASGINTYQNALTVTGNNITKANVPGYSRQEATQSARPAQDVGPGYIGAGVLSDGVRRIADEFLVNQLRLDTSAFNRLDSYLNNVMQIDSLLADPSTGLSSGMNNFFKAVEGGAQDPASIPSRQSVISEAQGLIERYHTLAGRLADQNNIINRQLESMATQISALASGIASLNNAIAKAQGSSLGNQPNDLLDQRDEKLRELAELVSVTVTKQESGIVNVFIGNGQALVIGTQANELQAREGVTDPFRYDLGFVQGSLFQTVSQDITGGEMGGVLDFRRDVLDRSFNEMGRIALAMADSMNTQQSLGVDLEGNIGSNFFNDINTRTAMEKRVVAHKANALPDDRVVTARINDTAQLTASDYLFEFKTPSIYTVKRLSDNKVVGEGLSGGLYPLDIDVDGMTIQLESGSFQSGDRFLVQPSRYAAQDITLAITRTQEVAFAVPIVTDASLGNLGNGLISQGSMLDVYKPDGSTLLDSFALAGQLSPPVVIRFVTPTSYDVLDNSDPANPVDLVPPMRSRRYVPGMSNEVFSNDPLQTSVNSSTALAFTLAAGNSNAYPAETISITMTNPQTGVGSTQTVALPASATARQAAQAISALSGVSATADTSVVLQVNDAAGGTMGVSLNGINLTDSGLGPVPVPVDADFLRDRINASGQLAQQGIIAVSDGTNLSVRSTTGEDLNFSVSGGAADQLTVMQANGTAAASVPIISGTSVTVGGLLTVEMANNGFLSSSLAAPGGRFSTPAPLSLNSYKGYQVALAGTPAAGDEFMIDFNTNGTMDNRNALSMAELATANTLQNSTLSFQEAYAQLVEFVGTDTAENRINQEASKSLLRQSQSNRDSLSGVNLDEEAALLIQFEQAYNASAQVINIARQAFDQLMAAFR